MGENPTQLLRHPVWCLLLLALCLCVSAQAQTLTVQGTVTSPDRNPLPGTSVMVKGTTRGTTADAQGHYSFEAAVGDTLVFNSIAYG